MHQKPKENPGVSKALCSVYNIWLLLFWRFCFPVLFWFILAVFASLFWPVSATVPSGSVCFCTRFLHQLILVFSLSSSGTFPLQGVIVCCLHLCRSSPVPRLPSLPQSILVWLLQSFSFGFLSITFFHPLWMLDFIGLYFPCFLSCFNFLLAVCKLGPIFELLQTLSQTK